MSNTKRLIVEQQLLNIAREIRAEQEITAAIVEKLAKGLEAAGASIVELRRRLSELEKEGADTVGK